MTAFPYVRFFIFTLLIHPEVEFGEKSEKSGKIKRNKKISELFKKSDVYHFTNDTAYSPGGIYQMQFFEIEQIFEDVWHEVKDVVYHYTWNVEGTTRGEALKLAEDLLSPEFRSTFLLKDAKNSESGEIELHHVVDGIPVVRKFKPSVYSGYNASYQVWNDFVLLLCPGKYFNYVQYHRPVTISISVHKFGVLNLFETVNYFITYTPGVSLQHMRFFSGKDSRGLRVEITLNTKTGVMYIERHTKRGTRCFSVTPENYTIMDSVPMHNNSNQI